ncbi:MAG: TetR/AcrR family transcriptional regulator [Anaerolineales bacterium]|nr:TetR/AcrR family transcriptional regulator [Anaerolineales bacterium]
MIEDPQPAQIDTEQRILNAAAQIFAELGYARSTTRKIAAAADVNEVTLFRYFGNKQNLFTAVLQQHTIPPEAATLFTINQNESYPEAMLNIGRFVMRILWERRDAMRMMLCEAAHFPELQATLGQAPRRLRDMIASYLKQQIASGAIKPRDPDMMAQAFLGFFFSYSMALGFLDQAMSMKAPDEELLVGFVDLFVQGTMKIRD